MSSTDGKHSPWEQVWRQFVPQGHDQAWRNAFYNVAAAVFVALAAAAAFSVYLILEPFVQALLWAVLFGSVLHPVKYQVVSVVHKWLLSIKETESPLSIKLALLPITFIDSMSEFIGRYVVKHMKGVIAVTVILPLVFVIIHHTPTLFSQLAYSIVYLFYSTIKCFLDIVCYLQYIVLLLLIAYLVCLTFYWNEKTKQNFQRLSLPVWVLLVAAFTCRWSVLSVPLFFIFIALLFGGVYTEAVELQRKQPVGQQSRKNLVTTVFQLCLGVCQAGATVEAEIEEVSPDLNASEDNDKSNESEEIERHPNTDGTDTRPEQVTDSPISAPSIPIKLVASTSQTSNSEKEDSDLASNMYLKTVFIACILVQLWRNSFLLSLLPLAIGYYVLKKATSHHLFGESGLRSKFNTYIHSSWDSVNDSFEDRKRALFPIPMRGVWKLIKRIDQQVVTALVSSTDTVVTLILMLTVMVLFVLFTIFLAVQIQGEGMHLIAMGSQLVNATIINNPQFQQMLPEGLNDVMGSTLDNAYLYGREWLSDMVRGILGETDEQKAAELEKQVIKLWDHIYQAWVAAHPQTPFVGPVVTSEAVALTFDSLIEGIRKTPGLVSITTLSDMIKANLGTVMSVADGIWTILLSNLSLAVSTLTAATSVVLGGSLSILNALLNMVVFISSLFYILSTSGAIYKPVAVLGGLTPGKMNTLGVAVEEAINGVFTASFKMGAFYGMWTWLLHSVFATNIVYIPAVLGAVFGAVPLVGTYWAAIPGAIELFWGHESPILALMLIIAQLLPLSCVDTAIYSEIKGGGHPYLTGLAVAGGIFCWGVEGAILGPLVLCILLVVTKMYASLIQMPGDVSQRLKNLRRCQSEIQF